LRRALQKDSQRVALKGGWHGGDGATGDVTLDGVASIAGWLRSVEGASSSTPHRRCLV
jgi:hypothetical protein